MKGMVLAAGFGTRLRPLTDRMPKALLPVAGHPMIAYSLALLRSAGITDVIVNLHHLGNQIRRRLGDGSPYGVTLSYSAEDPILDTGGAIKRAQWFLADDTFVVVNADTVIDLPLGNVIRWHRRHGALATMVLRPDPHADNFGLIEIDGCHRIRRFLGQPAMVNDLLTPLMFSGVHVFEPGIFAHMADGCFGVTRETYPRVLDAGLPVFGYVFRGYWRVLDTHDGLAQGGRELSVGNVLARSRRPQP